MRALFSAVFVLMLVAAPTLVAYAADTSVGTKVDDTGITTKVKAKLTAERAKNLVSVHVDTTDGVVHLQGTVPTEADKAEAERLARSTNGVREVTNDLQVSNPSASPSTK
ncbi:MAG: BON domain-containing protein [Candidatus Rokuibacteriota bacterium]|nr:MAG: BON domain-containing protein [Candidatus Rokubacteria bacterium]